VRAGHLSTEGDLGVLLASPRPEIAPAVLYRLGQIRESGGWVLVESGLADLPSDLRWLFESGAITLDQLAALVRTHGVTTVHDVGHLIAAHTLRDDALFGDAREETIASVLPALRAQVARTPLGRAVGITEPFLARLRAMDSVASASTTGSLRRGQDTIGDIELLAVTNEPSAVIDQIVGDPDAGRCLYRSEHRVYVRSERVQIGVRLPPPDVAGVELLFLTGSREHIASLQDLANTKGFRLDRAGLTAPSGARIAATEGEIYTALGLPCIPPEIRNGEDEVDVAARGALPEFVRQREIRGDLHMHTLWSDGRDGVETMVRACRALGYEYMAITDHSPSSRSARNLSLETVKQQADEIAALREQHPEITILRGCEVDILADGRLDFPDRVLETFDIVLASLHESLGHSPDQLMARYASAMKHPLVAGITHPTNRLVPYRAGYALDYDELFAIARDTGTFVEIDGAPSHLDLDGALARRAIAAGATLAVNSDCHRADMLARQMHLGIMTARRGWVEARHVLNTRPVADVRAAITAKRAGR